MGSLGRGQREYAKQMVDTLEKAIDQALRNKEEARRQGIPAKRMGIYVPKEVTIPYDLLRRLKDAGVLISDKPIRG